MGDGQILVTAFRVKSRAGELSGGATGSADALGCTGNVGASRSDSGAPVALAGGGGETEAGAPAQPASTKRRRERGPFECTVSLI
jgi:hypothetical protein